MSRKGRIVKINDETFRSCSVTQGIKKVDQDYYDKSQKHKGTNGTYYSNFRSHRSITMDVVAYECDEYDQTKLTFNIKDAILEQNPSWKRITKNRLDSIEEKLDGQKIDLVYNPITQSIGYDKTILKIED